jgi:hypothetical protein
VDSLKRRFPRYSKLLALYPAGYRKEYGEQMLQTLADMLDDPNHGKTAVWARTASDFPLSVIRQQLSYSGEAMTHTMPLYIKRNALLGAWLVAPFFLFVLLNGLMHDRLRHSWVWHTDALFVWLIVLPSLAATLNLVALLRWVRSRRHETKSSAWKVLTDFRLNWPALGMAILAAGILGLVFFHDSVHCVAGNPFRELHNPHQTWQCIEQR